MIDGIFPDITGWQRRFVALLYCIGFVGLGIFIASEVETYLLPSPYAHASAEWSCLVSGLIAVVWIASITHTTSFIRSLLALVTGLNFTIAGFRLIRHTAQFDHPGIAVFIGIACLVIAVKAYSLAHRLKSYSERSTT